MRLGFDCNTAWRGDDIVMLLVGLSPENDNPYVSHTHTHTNTHTQTHTHTHTHKHTQVELHVHSDGACRLTTLQELSHQNNLPYPHHSLEEFKSVVSLPNAVSSLTEFLKVFDALTNILWWVSGELVQIGWPF